MDTIMLTIRKFREKSQEEMQSEMNERNKQRRLREHYAAEKIVQELIKKYNLDYGELDHGIDT